MITLPIEINRFSMIKGMPGSIMDDCGAKALF